MTEPIDVRCSASGLAALSICESLILALGDLKMLSESEAIGVILDAANAHRGAGISAHEVALHVEVTAILDRIVAGGNSVRRP
jgi:hypothetical protein